MNSYKLVDLNRKTKLELWPTFQITRAFQTKTKSGLVGSFLLKAIPFPWSIRERLINNERVFLALAQSLWLPLYIHNNYDFYWLISSTPIKTRSGLFIPLITILRYVYPLYFGSWLYLLVPTFLSRLLYPMSLWTKTNFMLFDLYFIMLHLCPCLARLQQRPQPNNPSLH